MTEADKIRIAADIIYAEIHRGGGFVSHDQALSAARQIHSVWFRESMLHAMAPGEIARNFRQRYCCDTAIDTCECVVCAANYALMAVTAKD